MNTAFFNYVYVDPYVSLILTLFAKSAFFWTPVLYYVSDAEIRKGFKFMYTKKLENLPTAELDTFIIKAHKSLIILSKKEYHSSSNKNNDNI